MESPQRSEHLQWMAPPAGAHPKTKKPNSTKLKLSLLNRKQKLSPKT